jgi:hypothetical protein
MTEQTVLFQHSHCRVCVSLCAIVSDSQSGLICFMQPFMSISASISIAFMKPFLAGFSLLSSPLPSLLHSAGIASYQILVRALRDEG